MKSDRWQQIERICRAALEHEPSRRTAFLQEACAGDETLRREVEDLLAEETKPEDFLESPALEVEARAMVRNQSRPRLGQQVGSYEIVSLLGAGGMGEVYLARDATLGRQVALKFLPDFLQQDDTARRRFVQEAKLAAALDHPFICSVHEIGEEAGRAFISLEYVRGRTLREKLAEGPLTLAEAWKIAAEIAEALAEAHQRGIVHRDLKPANIMFTPDGHVKVMDFGLVKQLVHSPDQEQSFLDMTKTGTTVGTLPYMSPEQVRGQKVDTRSDLFSFGVILYEMLTGEHPFRRSVAADTAVAILGKEPEKIGKLRPEVTEELESVVTKLLAKEQEDRWQSVEEVRASLAHLVSDPSSSSAVALAAAERAGFSRATRTAVALLAVVAVAAALAGYWYYSHALPVRWAREEAIPEIERLIKEKDLVAAFHLADQAEEFLPGDPVLEELWPRVSLSMSVETEPSGADVYVRGYADLNGEWRHLGVSPVEGVRLPLQSHRWRVSREDYVTVDRATWVPGPSNEMKLQVELRSEALVRGGMVYVGEGAVAVVAAGALRLDRVVLDSFLIDRFEVTNREFKQFVDAGGYRNPQYWAHEFVKDGRVLSRQEGMAEFHDATGRPGPSTWSLGTYPEGQGEYPVGGVSWYEAAAYAQFVGKSLPAVHQWYRVANLFFVNSVPLSNFSGENLAPVGTHQGISPWGVYDMFGNVREWCWNASAGKRFILGGAWEDADYMFAFPGARSPFDRASANGFRCVQVGEIPADLTKPIEFGGRDYGSERPVDDRTFGIYRDLYAYDQTDLNAESETVESGSPYWNKERITFDAAYGGEKVTAYLFLPKAGIPPYQTVVFFPGSSPFRRSMKSDELQWLYLAEPIIRSGRALLYPIYKGSYERRGPTGQGARGGWDDSVAFRDQIILIAKDLSRSIDYLESRSDIASDQLGYFWVQFRGNVGPGLPGRGRASEDGCASRRWSELFQDASGNRPAQLRFSSQAARAAFERKVRHHIRAGPKSGSKV